MTLRLFHLFRPPPLAKLCGRELVAFFLDDERAQARLRFSDKSAYVVDLNARTLRRVAKGDDDVWLSLPGWVRIVNVIEDAAQAILIVSGAIYTARIAFRKSGGRWQLILSGGRIL